MLLMFHQLNAYHKEQVDSFESISMHIYIKENSQMNLSTYSTQFPLILS